MDAQNIEKLNQLISRSDMTGNEKVEWLISFINNYQALQLQQTGVIKSLPDFELQFCSNCFQMTNHLDNKCQKCKGNVL
jgi:hypothetical protein